MLRKSKPALPCPCGMEILVQVAPQIKGVHELASTRSQGLRQFATLINSTEINTPWPLPLDEKLLLGLWFGPCCCMKGVHQAGSSLCLFPSQTSTNTNSLTAGSSTPRSWTRRKAATSTLRRTMIFWSTWSAFWAACQCCQATSSLHCSWTKSGG